MYYLGTIYYNRLQFDKAILYFKQIVDLYPFDFDGLIMYAWTKLKLGNKKEAKDLNQPMVDHPQSNHYDLVVLAVAHHQFLATNPRSYLGAGGVLFDLKGLLPEDWVDERL